MNRRRNIVKRWMAGVVAVTMLSSVTGTPVFAVTESTAAPEAVEAKQVTAWSWTDALGLTQQEDTSSWTLSLQEEQTLSTADDLLALLPGSVEATIAQAEPEVTPVPDTTATPAPESSTDTDAADVTPVPDATPVSSETPDAEARDVDATEDGGTDVDTLSEDTNQDESGVSAAAAATPTPVPSATPQPEESSDPAASAELTEAPATTETLTLTWDTAALVFPLTAGDYTVTAALPDGYVLAESASALAVTVTVPGTQSESDASDVTEDAPADNALPDTPTLYAAPRADAGTVQTVNPVGTTINLFDYWIKDSTKQTGDWQFDAADWVWFFGDRCAAANDQGSGINAGHILKFLYGGNRVGGPNVYTESRNPYKDIVQKKLGADGYPWLNNLDTSFAGTGEQESLNSKKNESLGYLFNPAENNPYRDVHTNVKGLLKVTDDGYYSYNSDENYAWYNSNNNSFTVYDQRDTGFFPFNTLGSIKPVQDGDSQKIDANHYFGLTMTTRFVQQNNGFSTKDKSVPITYEFSGDDDVWVFIDNVLVGDLGGIHATSSLSIDFSTGVVKINDKYAGLDEPDLGRTEVTTITLKEIFDNAGVSAQWRNNTFENNTYHTLQLFYLERGNNTSNLSLKFNMESTTASSINNVDQDGHGQANIRFNLYSTQGDYKVAEDAVPVYSNVTETDGVLNMTDDAGNNVKLSNLRDLYGSYFVLREATPPEGYRTSADVHLKFMDNMDILLVENSTESGAYATPAVTVTLPKTVKKYDSNEVINTQDSNVLKGIFFAVVLKRGTDSTDDSQTWYPIYGDAMNGWHMGEKKALANNLSGVIEAAQKNSYMFVADNTGLRATIENLPGDLKQYYYILQQSGDANPDGNANYTVAYYYTSVNDLKNATTENTYRLSTDSTVDGDVQREFSAHVYVPNIKNYLVVQGVAEDGLTGLRGVTFGLFSDTQVTEQSDGSYVLNSANEIPLDTVKTKDLDQDNGDAITLKGGGIFPSNTNVLLESGRTYYLKEISTPEGYKVSDQIVKVIVDNSGIYADAGTGDDDVEVLRGAGKIVRSMLQFAVPDAINTTLTDIKATLNTLPEGVDPSTSSEWTPIGDPLYLSYHTSDVPLEYGLTSGTGDPYFVVESGWSRVTVTQNPAQPPEGYGPKQDLGDTDLTNLFSRSTIVRVKNDVQPCSLTLRESIETPVGNDANQEFTVTLTLKNASDTALSGSYPVTVSGTAAGDSNISSSLTLDSTGSVSIQLKLNQDVTLAEIPYGTRFTVTETPNEYYTSTYSVTVMGDTTLDQDHCHGSLTGDGSVTILNTRKTGGVSLTQNVSGPMGSYSDAFTYTLHLYDTAADDSQLPISGAYQGTFTPKNGEAQQVSVTFASDGTLNQITIDGESKAISLQDGDFLTLTNLPAGAVCEVTEDQNSLGYTTTVEGQSVLSGTVTVPAGTNADPITFINTRAEIIPTGLREENTPYLAMIGLAGLATLVGAAGWVEMRHRKRREEE